MPMAHRLRRALLLQRCRPWGPWKLPGAGALRQASPLRPGPVPDRDEDVGEEPFPDDDAHKDTPEKDEKKADDQVEDQVELMEWQSPWPFLSMADEKLCELSAGVHWPWKPSMASKLKDPSDNVRKKLEIADPSVEAMLAGLGSELDMAVVARVAAEGDREDLWEWLRERKAMLRKCSIATLAAVLSSLTRSSASFARKQSCRSLLRHVANEMLDRRISPRHSLVLLASLKVEASGGEVDDLEDENPMSVSNLLTLVLGSLSQRKDGESQLLLADIVPALEGLAALRQVAHDEQRNDLLSLARLLLGELRGGLGLSLLLAQSGQSQSGHNQGALLRLLAALAHLPEATRQASHALAALGGVRWTREATTSPDTTAAASFTLARSGAWASARANYLLSQALRRDRVAAERWAYLDLAEEARQATDEPRPCLVEDAEQISAVAGSWWLSAIAQSGLDIESAVESQVFAEHASSALFAAAERLADPGSKAPVAAKARALWALHALGKASEHQELADSLLQQLATADVASFCSSSWWLLREVQPISKAPEEADSDGAGSNPFTAWKEKLSQSLEAERRTWTSERGAELANVVQELGGADADEPKIAFLAQPFCLALYWPSRGKALDLDDRQAPVTRQLRRQHWATILPDVEVKEVSVEEWDEASGKNRLPLLESFLAGEPPE